MEANPIVQDDDRKLAYESPFATLVAMHNRRASGASHAWLNTVACSCPCGGSPPKLTQEEWDMVRELADAIAEPGFHPSAGQVAGVLLGRAVRAARTSMLDETRRQVKEATKTPR